jgi:uncharacterized membrane protein YeaQ/YmgE (transglycosylase-associated protein family)
MIGAAILGIASGFLARLLVPGRQDIGFLLTVVLGLAGAALGYVIFTLLLGIGDTDVFDLGSLPGAVIGSVILLVIYIKYIAPDAGGAPAPPTAADREGRQRDRDRAREQGAGPGSGQGGAGNEGGGHGRGERGGGGEGRRGRNR